MHRSRAVVAFAGIQGGLHITSGALHGQPSGGNCSARLRRSRRRCSREPGATFRRSRRRFLL